MIKIDNDAVQSGQTYGTIVKEDFERARSILTPETMLDWVTLALQAHNFEWRHPDSISVKGFRELRDAGYIESYGAMDWRFIASGGTPARSTREDTTRYTPERQNRVLDNLRTSPEKASEITARAYLDEPSGFSELSDTDGELPF